jgi:hypothetical protein
LVGIAEGFTAAVVGAIFGRDGAGYGEIYGIVVGWFGDPRISSERQNAMEEAMNG